MDDGQEKNSFYIEHYNKFTKSCLQFCLLRLATHPKIKELHELCKTASEESGYEVWIPENVKEDITITKLPLEPDQCMLLSSPIYPLVDEKDHRDTYHIFLHIHPDICHNNVPVINNALPTDTDMSAMIDAVSYYNGAFVCEAIVSKNALCLFALASDIFSLIINDKEGIKDVLMTNTNNMAFEEKTDTELEEAFLHLLGGGNPDAVLLTYKSM